jgi:hypothetical protein
VKLISMAASWRKVKPDLREPKKSLLKCRTAAFAAL